MSLSFGIGFYYFINGISTIISIILVPNINFIFFKMILLIPFVGSIFLLIGSYSYIKGNYIFRSSCFVGSILIILFQIFDIKNNLQILDYIGFNVWIVSSFDSIIIFILSTGIGLLVILYWNDLE